MNQFVITRILLCVTIVFSASIHTAVGQDETQPELLPDFAYTTSHKGYSGIYLRSGNRSKLISPKFKNAKYPTWSPDGKRIAFQAKKDGQFDLYILDIGTGEHSRLTNQSSTEMHPAWSPDGKSIAFEADPEDEYSFEIYLIDVDGKNFRRFTREIDGTSLPAWSPDGKQIAFSVPYRKIFKEGSENLTLDNKSVAGYIYVANKNGLNLRKITNGKTTCTTQAWTPDGNKIVFSSTRKDHLGKLSDMQLFVINSDGKNLRQLTKLPGQNISPNWSPHKDKILFHSTAYKHPNEPEKNSSEIYVINSDGTGLTRLTNNKYDDYFPVWRPVP
jgi:TolB protein